MAKSIIDKLDYMFFVYVAGFLAFQALVGDFISNNALIVIAMVLFIIWFVKRK